MDVRIGGASVHCAEYGVGMPVLALHGAGVDHREVAGALEPVFSEIPNYRRLYPDLPGMGLTPAPGTITSNDDVLDLLLSLIDHVIGDEPFLLLGHSYGSFKDRVAPSAKLVDEAALTRVFAQWELRDRPEAADTYPHPVLILAGRQDATAGYAGPLELAKHYPRATVAVLDRAGHALLHEQPELVQAHIAEWLQRVRGW